MAGIIGMLSPNDLKFLTHVTDEAFLVNAVPITIKRIKETESKQFTDALFDEVPEYNKTWEKTTIRMIATNRPDKEILDRFGTVNPIMLHISVSYLELGRALLTNEDGTAILDANGKQVQGWKLSPNDVIEYPNAYGETVDYYIEQATHDGEYRDTDGNQHPVSYTILLTDNKAPTR